MAKETYYFSHDYNARFDEKIKLLIRKHGMLGYGCYWAIVEDLYNNANALRLDYDGIAFDLRITAEQAKSLINDFDLFIIDGETFGSYSIERRLNVREEKSKNAKLSANLRWEKYRNAIALQTESDGNAIKERKGKEIKGNEYSEAHKHFAEKLFEAKDELDAIEVSTRKKPTPDTLKRFNANLVNQNKHHNHYSEYKKHFISWLTKQPETTLVEPKQRKKL